MSWSTSVRPSVPISHFIIGASPSRFQRVLGANAICVRNFVALDRLTQWRALINRVAQAERAVFLKQFEF